MADFGALLTTPAYLPAFEKVLGMLKSKDLISISKVSPEFFEVLKNKPKLWMPVINSIQRQRCLIHPELKLIRQKIFAERKYHEYVQHLMEFQVTYLFRLSTIFVLFWNLLVLQGHHNCAVWPYLGVSDIPGRF